MPDINMQVFEEAQRNQLVTEINIQTQVALNDYQVKLSDIANPTQSQDNVVIDRFGKFLPHWNESLDFDTWVKISMEVAGKQMLMLRGNSNVSNISSIDDATVFGDDFKDASVDTSKWTITGSNVAESGGTLQITGANSWNANGITSDVIFDRSSQGYIMVFRVKTSVAAGYKMFGYGPQPLNEGDGLYNYLDDGGGGIGRWRARYDGASGTPFINSISADTWYYSELLLKQTQGYTFFVNDTQYDDDSSFADNNHRVNINHYSSGQTLYFDYIFIRKHATTEPTYLIDVEQNLVTALKSLGRAG